jgi:hypothetical protein
VKYKDIVTEYQGESFNRSLYKKNGSEWDANQVGNYELVDDTGAVVSSGDLIKSDDNLSLTIAVPKADTATLVGSYRLLAHLTDTVDTTFDDVIAEYEITYLEKKAN